VLKAGLVPQWLKRQGKGGLGTGKSPRRGGDTKQKYLKISQGGGGGGDPAMSSILGLIIFLLDNGIMGEGGRGQNILFNLSTAQIIL